MLHSTLLCNILSAVWYWISDGRRKIQLLSESRSEGLGLYGRITLKNRPPPSESHFTAVSIISPYKGLFICVSVCLCFRIKCFDLTNAFFEFLMTFKGFHIVIQAYISFHNLSWAYNSFQYFSFIN